MHKERPTGHEPAEPLTFVDVFAGCGGLSLGLMRAGWKGLFGVEHDSNAFGTLHDNLVIDRANLSFAWPKWLPRQPHDAAKLFKEYHGELRKLAGKVHLLAGGPPCQGFSSAGKRNANDPRNRLVETYLEYVELLRPTLVLIENVRGITSDFGGADEKLNYATWIIGALSANYVVSTRMLDTSMFGVPQRRQRFFMIGVRRDVALQHSSNPFDTIERLRQTFLRTKGLHSVPVSAKAAISDFELARNQKRPSSESPGFEEIAHSGILLTSYQRLMNAGLAGPIPDTRLARHRPEISQRFAKIIALSHDEGRLNKSLSQEIKASLGLRKSAIRVVDPDSPAPTITSMPDDLLHYSDPRTLTVRENARLQSFPDWFAFRGKYTTGGERRRREVPRFTQVANAVPPLVAEAIGIALAQLIRPPSLHSAPIAQARPQAPPMTPDDAEVRA